MKDAEDCYNSYFEGFSKLKDHFTNMFNKTVRDGYITYNDITRRKCFFGNSNFFFRYKNDPELNILLTDSSFAKKFNSDMATVKRYSQNYPSQGTAADITKLATIYFYKEILKRGLEGIVLIVNIVHDELCVECPKEIGDEIAELVKQCMEKAGDIFCETVPLKATPIIGDFWVH